MQYIDILANFATCTTFFGHAQLLSDHEQIQSEQQTISESGNCNCSVSVSV